VQDPDVAEARAAEVLAGIKAVFEVLIAKKQSMGSRMEEVRLVKYQEALTWSIFHKENVDIVAMYYDTLEDLIHDPKELEQAGFTLKPWDIDYIRKMRKCYQCRSEYFSDFVLRASLISHRNRQPYPMPPPSRKDSEGLQHQDWDARAVSYLLQAH
jgi:hypothetical protein